MKKIDARKQTRNALCKRRQQVISLYRENMPVMKIVENSGLSWPAVNFAIKQSETGENFDLMPAQRGRKNGAGRVLSVEQEAELRYIICRKRPYQFNIKISSRNIRLSLWNREAVMQLIEQKCGLKLSERCVAKYLERWGFPLVKKWRCSKDIKKWLIENSNDLEHRAQSENADIYRVDKTPLTSSDTLQTTKKKGYQHKLYMVSAINNQGKIHWLIIQGQFTAELQIKFLRALANDPSRSIFLILGKFGYYCKAEVLDWLRKNGKIEIFPPQNAV